jgi:hypothetical protein
MDIRVQMEDSFLLGGGGLRLTMDFTYGCMMIITTVITWFSDLQSLTKWPV